MAVPFLSDVLGGTPETYQSAGHRRRDRHLKIHDYRDNLRAGVTDSADLGAVVPTTANRAPGQLGKLSALGVTSPAETLVELVRGGPDEVGELPVSLVHDSRAGCCTRSVNNRDGVSRRVGRTIRIVWRNL
jgi:hypothetical protein